MFIVELRTIIQIKRGMYCEETQQETGFLEDNIAKRPVESGKKINLF